MPTATPAAASQRHSLFSALRSLADDIRSEKTAGAKPVKPGTKTAAELPADPGGYQGASTHPSADADNHGHALQTGSRASENETDVKADQGPPGVDSTPEGVVKDQDGQQLNIGTEQSATGEDPSVEDDYKGDKDDPGTSHPAKATIGEKYGSLKFADAKAKAGTLAQEILADLAAGFGKELVAGVKVAGKKPAAAPAPAKPAAAPKTAAANQPAPAAGASPTSQLLQKAANAVSGNGQSTAALRAGYELAAALGIDKQAAEQTVQTCLVETLRDADLDATLVGEYVSRHKQSQVRPSQGTKRGADRSDAAAGEDHNKPGDGKSGTGEAHPSGGGEGGGEGGEAERNGQDGGDSLGDVLGGGSDPGQMLGGAGGGGGGAPPPGDPMAGGGAPGGGAPGGGGAGGGMDEQAALQELVSALIELGIPPEQLAQLAGSAGAGGGAAGGGMGGGMGGGAPPMGGPAPGGAPPMPAPGGAAGGPPGMSEGMKLASAAKAFQRSGNFRFKEASDGSEARALRDEMKVYILDLIKTAQKRAA